MENFAVNATLVVQIVNFFIAYLLFRFLLFAPAHHIIVQEHHDHEMLTHHIKDTQAFIDDKKVFQVLIWQQCHEYYLANIPHIPQKVAPFREVAPLWTYETMNNQQRDKLIAHEVDQLMRLLGPKK